MYEIFLDAFIDSAKMIPFLLIIYVGIELIEYKFGARIREKVKNAGSAGPVIGAVAGSLPQCGFSVMATALYTQRLTTIGTLLAVYLATSDEAIPIILSQPEKVGVIIPIILIKIFVALLVGYTLDFIFRKKNKEVFEHIKAFDTGHDEPNHHHEAALNEHACCDHAVACACTTGKFNAKEIFLHPIIHTAKIFIYIFIISFGINWAIFAMGQDFFANLFLKAGFLQPILAALIGLIPNCAASVAVTELYLQGAITFGSVIAGLCASGGLGILILFKEEKNKKDAFKIVVLLFVISIFSGLVVQYFVK